jgi:hypothetical protein
VTIRVSEKIRVGARLADTTTLIDTPEKAKALLDAGIEGVFQYLGSVTPAVVENILSNGLGFMPVTYADQFDGIRAVAEMKALGIPLGTTAWLDVEAVSTMDKTMLKAKINAWGSNVQYANHIAGIYVGEGNPLSADELYNLVVTRYWMSASIVPIPRCHYCVYQLFPTVVWGGVSVDLDFVREDAEGRVPTWAKAA